MVDLSTEDMITLNIIGNIDTSLYSEDISSIKNALNSIALNTQMLSLLLKKKHKSPKNQISAQEQEIANRIARLIANKIEFNPNSYNPNDNLAYKIDCIQEEADLINQAYELGLKKRIMKQIKKFLDDKHEQHKTKMKLHRDNARGCLTLVSAIIIFLTFLYILCVISGVE